MGILSVEARAAMSDSTIETLPFPGRRDLPKLAKMFLEAQKDADLAAQNAELLERCRGDGRNFWKSRADEPKRGPGRPRKEETEAELA
jgi:hypothetical protein